jgi:serine/threonine-protein kinase
VLWELLTHQRLFQGDGDLDTYQRALEAVVAAPSQLVPEVPTAIDAIVLKGLSRAQGERFATARDMARAIEETGLLASARDVGSWVERIAHEPLAVRARALSAVEQDLAPADAWRELDPAQARDDASLLRKLDRRAESEQVTDVRNLVEAPEDLPGPPSSVDSVVTAIASQSATLGSRERARNRWPIWLTSSLAALLLLGLLWSLKRPQGTLPAVVATPKVSTASPPMPALVAPPEAPLPKPDASVSPALHAPLRHHPANHSPSAEAAVAEQLKPAPERPKPDCSVAFTVDEHGFRIPKRECL